MKMRPVPQLTSADVRRFWSKVDLSGGPDACWPWRAASQRDGRGIFHVGATKQLLASRVAFAIATGRDPEAENVCHRCDNPPCCNPAHLFLGDQAANVHDMRQKGRASDPPRNDLRGERQPGAKLTEAAVMEMRQDRRANGTTFKALGRRFGVHAMTARRAVRGIDWKHVGGPVCAAS